jgi:hypothetical protein
MVVFQEVRQRGADEDDSSRAQLSGSDADAQGPRLLDLEQAFGMSV